MNWRVRAWRFVCRTLRPDQDAAGISSLADEIRSSGPMWPWVVRFADVHLVTPALWTGLERKNLVAYLPREVKQYLESVYQMNARRNASLLGQLDEAVRVWNARGIVPVLLKGAAYLKIGIYDDPAGRILSDLDVWIEERRIPEALEAVVEIGYRDAGEGRDWSRHRHCAPMFRANDVARIEIHRRLFDGKAREVLPDADARAELVERSDHGLRYSCLAPTPMTLMSFLHSHVVDRYGDTFTIALRPIQDLVTLDAAYKKRIAWNRIRELTMRHGVAKPFRDYLLAARRTVGLTPIPETSFGLRDWTHYGVSYARARWRMVDWLLWRLDDFSSYKIGRARGKEPNVLILNYDRLRFLSRGIFRRAFSMISDH